MANPAPAVPRVTIFTLTLQAIRSVKTGKRFQSEEYLTNSSWAYFPSSFARTRRGGNAVAHDDPTRAEGQ